VDILSLGQHNIASFLRAMLCRNACVKLMVSFIGQFSHCPISRATAVFYFTFGDALFCLNIKLYDS